MAAVLGRKVTFRPARLPGFRLVAVREGSSAALVPGTGAAAGVILDDPGPEAMDRLRFFEGGVEPVAMVTEAGMALVFPGAAAADAPDWLAADWTRRWSATVLAAVPDVMRLMGRRSAAAVGVRWPQMLTRAGARVRAAASGPATLRRIPADADVWRQSGGSPTRTTSRSRNTTYVSAVSTAR